MSIFDSAFKNIKKDITAKLLANYYLENDNDFDFARKIQDKMDSLKYKNEYEIFSEYITIGHYLKMTPLFNEIKKIILDFLNNKIESDDLIFNIRRTRANMTDRNKMIIDISLARWIRSTWNLEQLSMYVEELENMDLEKLQIIYCCFERISYSERTVFFWDIKEALEEYLSKRTVSPRKGFCHYINLSKSFKETGLPSKNVKLCYFDYVYKPYEIYQNGRIYSKKIFTDKLKELKLKETKQKSQYLELCHFDPKTDKVVETGKALCTEVIDTEFDILKRNKRDVKMTKQEFEDSVKFAEIQIEKFITLLKANKVASNEDLLYNLNIKIEQWKTYHDLLEKNYLQYEREHIVKVVEEYLKLQNLLYVDIVNNLEDQISNKNISKKLFAELEQLKNKYECEIFYEKNKERIHLIANIQAVMVANDAAWQYDFKALLDKDVCELKKIFIRLNLLESRYSVYCDMYDALILSLKQELYDKEKYAKSSIS